MAAPKTVPSRTLPGAPMRHLTRSVLCPVCRSPAILAFATADPADDGVDPNHSALTCPNNCRPTFDQVDRLLNADGDSQ
jgi:hypothetical protein